MKVKMRRVLMDLWIEPDEDAEGKAPRTGRSKVPPVPPFQQLKRCWEIVQWKFSLYSRKRAVPLHTVAAVGVK